MARLQILQLPEGAGDERPPFILVIDQVVPGAVEAICAAERTTAELIGARAIFSFEETVEIPANNPAPLADDPERADTTQIVHTHERTRLDLCHALLVSGDTTWRKLAELVAERQRELADLYRERDELHAEIGLVQGQLHSAALSAVRGKHATIRELIERAEQAEAERDEARLWARHGYEIGQRHCGWSDHGVAPAWLTEGWPPHFDSCEHLVQAAALDEALTRVHNEPTEPEVMNAQQEHPSVWKHGYHCGVLAAKSVARPRHEKTSKP